VRGDDLLARLGMIHLRLGVGEEMVEGIVEDAGGDKRVDIADSETVSSVSNFALEVLAMVWTYRC